MLFLGVSGFAQVNLSLNSTGILGLSNRQFAGFGDIALRTEFKSNPAFGIYADLSTKRIYEYGSRGFSLETGMHYYNKPNAYWAVGIGLHFFDELNQNAIDDEDVMILLTDNEVYNYLPYMAVYRHHKLNRIIDLKYGFEYGYRLREKEAGENLFKNELEDPVLYIGAGVGFWIYQIKKRRPDAD